MAAHIDEEIFRRYRLFPSNYIALDELEGTTAHADRYTADDKARFDGYIKQQIEKIQVPGKDEAFLRERMLTMYANPARNQENTK